MGLHNKEVVFGEGGSYSGYLALEETAETLPGLVVIQEAWGLNAHLRDVSDRFAKAGYAVLAPDLFAHKGGRPEALTEPRIQGLLAFINSMPSSAWGNPLEREAAMAKLPPGSQGPVRESYDMLFGQAMGQRTEHLKILQAGLAHLRALPACRGRKIGSLGFCMGGGLSGALAAQDPGLGAAVIFYGQAIPSGSIPALRCKVLAFHGELDKRLVSGLPEFESAMSKAGKSLECHVYPGAAHAFFNDTRPAYNATAARQSFARCLSFLEDELGAA